MPLRLLVHVPEVVCAPDDWDPRHRARLQRVVSRAIARAAADLHLADVVTERVPPDRPARRHPSPPRPRGGDVRERFDPSRRVAAGGGAGAYTGSGRPGPRGGQRAVTAAPAAPGVSPAGRAGALPGTPAASADGAAVPDGAGDELVTSQGDRVVRRPLGRTLVLGASRQNYVFTGRGPHVVAGNLARALEWGKEFFGGSGFAVLQRRGGRGDGPFYVVGLEQPLSIKDLGGLAAGVAGVPGARVVRGWGVLADSASFRTVTVVTADGLQLVRLGAADHWNARAYQAALARVPAAERDVRPSDVQAGAAALIQARPEGPGDEGMVAFITAMDHTVFAAIPWEVRADYLRVLALAGDDERAGDAVVAIVRATRTGSELEAMFALLRRWGVYERLFTPPGARVFRLLIALGEFSPQGPPGWHYLAALVEELQSASDDEELARLGVGLRTWIGANLDAIRTLLTDPAKVIEGLVHLAELLWVIDQARRGDPKAQAVVEQMVHQVNEAIIKAIRGLQYAEALGLPEGHRDAGANIGGNLFGILKYALLFEILSWFIGLGEVLDALKAVQGSERVEALGRLLASLRGLARAAKAGEAATRMERIVPALVRLAGLAEEAEATRLIALLAPEQLALLDRVGEVAEAAQLTRGADLDALRLALAGKPELLRGLDGVGDTLAVLGRADGRLAEAGGLSAEAAAGLSAVIKHTGWDRATLVKLIDGVPAAGLNDFLRTLPFVRPELFARWGADGLRALAQRPRLIAALRDLGGDLTDLASAHATDLDRLERLLHGLELRNKQIGDKVLVEGLRKRLEKVDPAAFAEVADALHAENLAEATRTGKLAELGAARVAQGGREVLLRRMAALAERDAGLFRFRATELDGLTDKELDGLEVVARLKTEVLGWDDVLDAVLTWKAEDRADFLGLFADVGPHTDAGLEVVLTNILGRNVRKAGQEVKAFQGSWGQLYAGRTLIGQGARHLEFEVPRIESGLRREADIVAQLNGKVYVEVKTNLEGTPSFVVEQVRRDLVIHAPTHYDDLLYMYNPRITKDQLAELGQDMLRLFDNPRTRQLFHERGLDISRARQDFQRWLESGRLTTYTF